MELLLDLQHFYLRKRIWLDLTQNAFVFFFFAKIITALILQIFSKYPENETFFVKLNSHKSRV